MICADDPQFGLRHHLVTFARKQGIKAAELAHERAGGIVKKGSRGRGEKVFVVTRQQKDGWEGWDRETSEIVPEKPLGAQAGGEGALTLKAHMHKGCTRDAQGMLTGVVRGEIGRGKISGMVRQGDRTGKKILPLGQGDLDLQLLRTIRDSGRRGPIGVSGR